MPIRNAKNIRDSLKTAGYTNAAVNAVWPSWWHPEADNSASAIGELCFSIARKLGINPMSLLDDNIIPTPSIGLNAVFKHLKKDDQHNIGILSAFGVGIGRLVTRATDATDVDIYNLKAKELRAILLKKGNVVSFHSLLALCWGLGIPVLHLKVFPLETKAMSAMAVNIDGRYAILLAKDSTYPASPSFLLAHELGHIIGQHLANSSAIVDLDVNDNTYDAQEKEADSFAQKLLIGDKKIKIAIEPKSGKKLAEYLLSIYGELNIEPGILALHIGHLTGNWDIANSALNYIYTTQKDVATEVNRMAFGGMDMTRFSQDELDYLYSVTNYAQE